MHHMAPMTDSFMNLERISQPCGVRCPGQACSLSACPSKATTSCWASLLLMGTVSCLDWGSPKFCSFCASISLRQHDLLAVCIPVACCLQMVAEIVKDAHLSDFAWILRPMDEHMQTLWMSGEFVTIFYRLRHVRFMHATCHEATC